MKKLGIMIMAALVAATAARAETLALWENDNLTTSTNSTPVDSTAPGISAGDLALANIPHPDAANAWDNTLDAYISDALWITNLTEAIAGSRYYSFTVTPDTGKQVNYSNVFTRVFVNGSGGVETSVKCFLMSSETGFAVGDEIGSFTATSQWDGTGDSTTNSFDVSGIDALQEQPSPVEFRLYIVLGSGSFSRVGIGHAAFADAADDVRVDGTVEDATSLPVVTLAAWDLTGLAANSKTAAVDTVHADMSSSDLVSGSGILLNDGYASVGWSHSLAGFAHWALPSSLEYAIQTGNNYYTLTLTPGSGNAVSYKSLFARFSANTANSTNDITFHLLSSQTGFSTNAVLGSFNIQDNVPDYNPTPYTHEFDLGAFPELQDLTEATEFRIYATSVAGNRMGIGYAFNATGAGNDLVVSGTIEELAYVPATIVSWTSVSENVMKLVVDAPADPALYYPKATTDLTLGFSSVAHSASSAGPFEITNLTVSAVEGNNKAIYVETTADQKFFGIGAE